MRNSFLFVLFCFFNLQSSVVITNVFDNLKDLYKPVITFNENIGSVSLVLNYFGLVCIDYKYKLQKYALYDDLDLTIFLNFSGSDYSRSLLGKNVAFVSKFVYKLFNIDWFVEYTQSVFLKYDVKIKCGGQKEIADGVFVKSTICLYPKASAYDKSKYKYADIYISVKL